MIKPTPNPPVTEPASITDPTSPYECPDSKRFNEAANRALDYHLGPMTAHIMAAPSPTAHREAETAKAHRG